MKHRERIRRHYEPRLDRETESYRILDWASPQSQQARFQVLADEVPLTGKSLLDVGCGLGDLYGFLRARGIDAAYTGVDILDRMIEEARRRHGDAVFVCMDLFSGDTPPGTPFDVVFCSGAFNLNMGNARTFLPAAVRRLLELTAGTLVFNLLHARAAGPDRTYVYHDPADVQTILHPLDVKYRILEDYLPNDFTVIAEK